MYHRPKNRFINTPTYNHCQARPERKSFCDKSSSICSFPHFVSPPFRKIWVIELVVMVFPPSIYIIANIPSTVKGNHKQNIILYILSKCLIYMELQQGEDPAIVSGPLSTPSGAQTGITGAILTFLFRPGWICFSWLSESCDSGGNQMRRCRQFHQRKQPAEGPCSGHSSTWPVYRHNCNSVDKLILNRLVSEWLCSV